MPFAMITAPVVSVAGNTTAGRRTAAKSASLRTTSESAVSFSTPKRGKTIIPSAFGFGKKAAPEPEEEEEEEPEDFTDGNPFASVGGKVMGALEDSPKLKMPSLGGFNFPGTQDEDPSFDEYGDEDETPDAPSGGNPFASFGGFGTVGKTIDQTVDLDYEDDEEEEEEKSSGKPFGGFALPSFGGGKKEQAPEPEPVQKSQPREMKMGNWERTLKENVKNSDVPTWTLDPEPIRGASLKPIKLRTDDILVVGRDKGPGIDVVAKVGCVSGVHCQLEMEGNKLYVTDLGSTNGTYVDGQEMRKNNRYRVFNGSSLRLGAENVNGEPFVTYDVELSGAVEMDRNSEYGQVQAIVEALGGPKVVVNFLSVNVAFQVGFYILLQLQTD